MRVPSEPTPPIQQVHIICAIAEKAILRAARA